VKLTKRIVERLVAPDPSGKQRLAWDDTLKGFGVLISGKTRSKSYVVQRKLPGGLTRRVTVGSVAELDLDRARDVAADLLQDIRRGRDPKRRVAPITLRRALEAYLAAGQLTDKSVRGYRAAMERLADWLDRPLTAITRDMVMERHHKIQADVVRRTEWDSLSGASTANGVMRVLRAVWNHSTDMPNPVRLRRQWYAEPRRERLIRADQLPAWYAAVDALANRTMSDYLKLLLFTGFRRSEAAALRWEEIDLAARLIRLPAKRTKARRMLALPMSSFVYDLLSHRPPEAHDYVFPSRGGHIVEPRAGLERVAVVTGIHISAHDLRRTFITVAESADISPLALKALVNHSIGQDVTAGYVRITAERLREPAQRVCDRLMELCGV
jgi:integrase